MLKNLKVYRNKIAVINIDLKDYGLNGLSYYSSKIELKRKNTTICIFTVIIIQ